MKMKSFFFLSAAFLVTFSILLSVIPNISFADSARQLKRRTQETERIKKFEGTVKRDGDTLFLRSGTGPNIALKNSPGCGAPDTCIQYRFIDYFRDIGFFLVKGYYGKKIEHIMISESDGKEYYIHELPRFSLDRRHLVTVTDNTNTGYDMTGVFIWRIEGMEIIPEFSYEPEDSIWYKFVRWVDNRYIELTKWLFYSGGHCPERAILRVPVDLKKEADGWKMYENFLPGSPECVNGW